MSCSRAKRSALTRLNLPILNDTHSQDTTRGAGHYAAQRVLSEASRCSPMVSDFEMMALMPAA